MINFTKTIYYNQICIADESASGEFDADKYIDGQPFVCYEHELMIIFDELDTSTGIETAEIFILDDEDIKTLNKKFDYHLSIKVPSTRVDLTLVPDRETQYIWYVKSKVADVFFLFEGSKVFLHVTG